ncbi:hypothetical protein D3C80_1675430 [compost metagenome]
MKDNPQETCAQIGVLQPCDNNVACRLSGFVLNNQMQNVFIGNGCSMLLSAPLPDITAVVFVLLGSQYKVEILQPSRPQINIL